MCISSQPLQSFFTFIIRMVINSLLYRSGSTELKQCRNRTLRCNELLITNGKLTCCPLSALSVHRLPCICATYVVHHFPGASGSLSIMYTLHQKKVTFSSSIFPGNLRLGSVTLGHFQKNLACL